MRNGVILLFVWVAVSGAFYEWGGAAGRGVRQLKKGQHKDAVKSLGEGRGELPHSARVRYDQALAFAGAELTDSARVAYHEAFTSPSLVGEAARAAAAYNLGNTAMNMGEYGPATSLYRESLRIDPTRTDAKKNLEEAIRRTRNERRPPQGETGQRDRAQDEEGQGKPQPGQKNDGSPPPEEQSGERRPDSPGGQAPQLGSQTPGRSEAEHWLDALEAERKSERLRDHGGPGKETGQRDW